MSPILDRRSALLALLASSTGLLAWREAQARGGAGALYLTCRDDAQLAHHLTAIDSAGAAAFDLPLPGRGHGMALHPGRPDGVVFARRPGTFAVVFDHAQGTALHRFDAAPGRHFYGHGTFSADGRHLFTTENAYETGRGVVGVRDAGDAYRQLDEIDGGGIGPHELLLMPDGATLAVANGGIRTHPDHDRDPLNLDTMLPSLARIEIASGRLVSASRLAPELHQDSIRHLAVDREGRVAAALQHEGPADMPVPLVCLTAGDALVPLPIPEPVRARLRQYIGSIAFDSSGRLIAASAPKAGLTLLFDAAERRYLGAVELRDGCGVAAAPDPATFLLTSGLGQLARLRLDGEHPVTTERVGVAGSLFDNHAVRAT